MKFEVSLSGISFTYRLSFLNQPLDNFHVLSSFPHRFSFPLRTGGICVCVYLLHLFLLFNLTFPTKCFNPNNWLSSPISPVLSWMDIQNDLLQIVEESDAPFCSGKEASCDGQPFWGSMSPHPFLGLSCYFPRSRGFLHTPLHRVKLVLLVLTHPFHWTIMGPSSIGSAACPHSVRERHGANSRISSSLPSQESPPTC